MLTKENPAVLNELFGITDLFEADIKNFLNKFDNDDLFLFSNAEEKQKKALSLYSAFTIKLNKYVNLYEASIADLSRQLCEADKICDLSLTVKLSSEFERYTLLFTTIKKFITECDASLQNNEKNFKQSTIIASARELLSTVTNYKNNF